MSSSRITDESGWLQYHSVGQFPGQRPLLDAALKEAADAWLALDDRRWQVLEGRRRQAIQSWARLVGAEATSVFTVENVTLAFHAFIDSLPAPCLLGRTVLVAEDCFPSIYYLLRALAPRIGYQLRTVAIADGSAYVTEEQFLDEWDDRVALAVVNWISSVSSKRADLPRLIAHAKRVGSLVALDATQGIGIVPIDVTALDVDFAASTSLKWTCGVPGAGFGYVTPRLLQGLSPRVQGWYSQPAPSNWALEEFTLAPDARRFGNGTASVFPYAASLPGLDWVLHQGVSNLRRHNVELCERLITIADHHGLRLVTPRDAEQRGGSIMIELVSVEEADAARRRLLANGLICDVRGRRLRWSPGAVTTMAALDLLDEIMDGAVPKAAR